MKFEGVITPLVTPLNEEEELDEEALRRLVRYVVEGGVHGVIVCGTTGEYPAIRDNVRQKAVEVVLDEVRQRGRKVAVIAGASDTGTRRVVENIKRLEKLGLDGVLITPPYFFMKVGDDQLYEHYRIIGQESPFPVLIYNIPQLTHTPLSAELIIRLSQLPGIVGIKDCTGDMGHLKRIIEGVKGEFSVLQGLEEIAFESLLAGADGFVASISNLIPAECARLYEICQESRAEGEVLQRRINSIARIYEWGRIAGGLKCALSILGLCGEKVASPNWQCDESWRARVAQILEEEGITHA